MGDPAGLAKVVAISHTLRCPGYRLFSSPVEAAPEVGPCENSMPRAATASARACFSSWTSKTSALATVADDACSGVPSVLVEREDEDEGEDEAVAAALSPNPAGEPGGVVRCCCGCCCCCCCLDASTLSSSVFRLFWRLPPLPPADLDEAALAEAGGHGLELEELLPLCPMNMRICVYLGMRTAMVGWWWWWKANALEVSRETKKETADEVNTNVMLRAGRHLNPKRDLMTDVPSTLRQNKNNTSDAAAT